ncbi:hypothetical protein [Prosthecobacter vanneervenii]|uniref:CHAT domain-containing protein n=1 Tax=Prosthecobacter vanneervenii TaxID=48466 RepID=A0A7W8DLN9_9BACT|nr:hypothetical protein [Prosthecobacter vanneervenii]MBB5034250.1 hypothetical protein [Prosthecobacter vanneervenii]
MTHPEVFIIESLNPDDERASRFEGRIISDILHLSGKQCEYRYIRTKRELMWAVQTFIDSDFRYLHISSHGNPTTMFTTLDTLPFADFAQIVRPALRNRRLFISACSMTNTALADAIMPGSGCYSLIGPRKDVYFADAALLWASFYHLMFKRNEAAMKRADIIDTVHSVASTFDVPLRYYSASNDVKGYKTRGVKP